MAAQNSPQDAIVNAHAVYADREETLWVIDDASPRVCPAVPAPEAGALRPAHQPLHARLPVRRAVPAGRIGARAHAKRWTPRVRHRVASRCVHHRRRPPERARVEAARRPSATQADPSIVPVVQGREFRTTSGQVPQVHVDLLELDAGNRWLYFAALCGPMLRRVETKYLVDESLSDADVAFARRRRHRRAAAGGTGARQQGQSLHLRVVEGLDPSPRCQRQAGDAGRRSADQLSQRRRRTGWLLLFSCFADPPQRALRRRDLRADCPTRSSRSVFDDFADGRRDHFSGRRHGILERTAEGRRHIGPRDAKHRRLEALEGFFRDDGGEFRGDAALRCVSSAMTTRPVLRTDPRIVFACPAEPACADRRLRCRCLPLQGHRPRAAPGRPGRTSRSPSHRVHRALLPLPERNVVRLLRHFPLHADQQVVREHHRGVFACAGGGDESFRVARAPRRITCSPGTFQYIACRGYAVLVPPPMRRPCSMWNTTGTRIFPPEA